MKEKITIGITDCSKYENYHRWIENDPGVEVIKLSYHDKNIGDISKCDGVILSGGEDVHPRFYDKNEYLELCEEIDEQRDDFEWKVLEHTEKNALPVLGICRGLQVVNVFFGGTLIPHIPAFGKFDHSRTGSVDRYHLVRVDPNSEFHSITGATSGEVNSAHHQAADRVGKGLVASALSSDGVVEAIERDKRGSAFLQLVQWHPERMNNPDSAFSKNIRLKFVDACREVFQGK